MTLSNFNSYFEILVGLNLGFATFDYFRKELSDSIFKKNHLTEKLNDLISRLEVHQSEKRDNVEFHKSLEYINKKVKLETKNLDLKENRERCYFTLLRPISFVLSLLCITYLVVAAFQDSTVDINEKIFFSDYIFRLTCLVASFIFTIFYCTLSERVLQYNVKIGLFESILVFLFLAIISCNRVYFYFFDNLFLQILSLILIPFSAYIILTTLRIKKTNKYAKRDNKKLIQSFYKLCKQNIFPSLLYLIIVLTALIPVFLYYSFNMSYVMHLIVIVTPLSLFIYIYLRTAIHKKVYGRKYLKLSNEHSTKLDFVLESIEKADS